MPNKKISQLNDASFPLSGAEELPIAQSGQTVKVTVGDVANTAISLEFFWNLPDRIFSARIDGKYKPLGIKFKNLVLEPGATYTLLIDRWRFSEIKVPMATPQVFRGASFYHEANPGDNGRQNEIQITSTTQVFDFNQDFYFREYSGTNPCDGPFPKLTGQGRKGIAKNNCSATLKLGFRIRVDHPTKGTYETPILGTVLMTGQDLDLTGRTISYRNI